MGLNENISTGERAPIRIENALLSDAWDMVGLYERATLHTYPNDQAGITREDVKHLLETQRGQPGVEAMQNLMEQQLDGGVVYTAKQGRNLVGFIMAKKGERSNQIHSLYIDPVFQAQGVGKVLMQKALNFLGEEKDIKVEVAAYNVQAIRFYHSCGFNDTGKESERRYVELTNGKRMPEIMLLRPARKSENVPSSN